MSVGDQIYSQYLLSVTSVGFYSASVSAVFNVSGVVFERHWLLPAFYVGVAGPDLGDGDTDRVPPARIMDLRAVTYGAAARPGFFSLVFTAPGDNLNQGEGGLARKLKLISCPC